MKKLLLVFCFALLMSGSAAAQPVTLTNIGTVDLPPGIVVATVDKDADATRYVLRIKDGAVWRSLSIEKLMKLPDTNSSDYPPDWRDVAIETYAPLVPGKQDNKKTMQIFWELLLLSPSFKPYTLSIEPAKKFTLAGKDCVHATFKFAVPNVAIILHREAFMVSEPDGVKIFTFTCADGDLPYWQPFMLNIAGATP